MTLEEKVEEALAPLVYHYRKPRITTKTYCDKEYPTRADLEKHQNMAAAAQDCSECQALWMQDHDT